MMRKSSLVGTWVGMAAGVVAMALMPAVASASASGLMLDVQIDERAYLEDQRIEVAVCLRNESEFAFRDLAPLHPSGGYLMLNVIDLATDAHIPRRGTRPLTMVDHEGAVLGPGQSQCEAFNLLAWYGEEGGKGPSLASCLGSRSLPAGRYRLSVTFHARSGFVPELAPAVVRAREIDFSIESISTNRAQVELVRRFTGSCPKVERVDRGPIERHCAAWLPAFKNSPYFMLIYYFTGRLMTSISADSLLSTLDLQGGNGVRQASLIALRCSIERRSDQDRRKWMETLRRRRGDELSRTLIDTWLSRTPEPRVRK